MSILYVASSLYWCPGSSQRCLFLKGLWGQGADRGGKISWWAEGLWLSWPAASLGIRFWIYAPIWWQFVLLKQGQPWPIFLSFLKIKICYEKMAGHFPSLIVIYMLWSKTVSYSTIDCSNLLSSLCLEPPKPLFKPFNFSFSGKKRSCIHSDACFTRKGNIVTQGPPTH